MRQEPSAIRPHQDMRHTEWDIRSGRDWIDLTRKILSAEVLREMSFSPCRAEPDIWMRPSKDGAKYEYVAVYVGDLALALENPQEFLDTLTGKYNFKLKGSGPITFHLGMDFGRDEDGTLYFTSKRYVEKILSNYERIFGEPPKRIFHSPLEKLSCTLPPVITGYRGSATDSCVFGGNALPAVICRKNKNFIFFRNFCRLLVHLNAAMTLVKEILLLSQN